MPRPMERAQTAGRFSASQATGRGTPATTCCPAAGESPCRSMEGELDPATAPTALHGHRHAGSRVKIVVETTSPQEEEEERSRGQDR